MKVIIQPYIISLHVFVHLDTPVVRFHKGLKQHQQTTFRDDEIFSPRLSPISDMRDESGGLTLVGAC